VLFDFGGVLAEEGFREGLMAIGRLNRIDPEAVYTAGVEITFAGGFATNGIDEQLFWDALRHKTGVTGVDETLRKEVLSRFVVRPWMIEIVKALRARHLVTAILSDQTKWLDELDRTYGFFQWFDRVYNSYYLGRSKQDPGVFDYVVGELGIKGEEALFIDDSEGNIARARGRGLCGILYQDRPQFEAELLSFFPLLRGELVV
jgi:putative hydrolase of the HAD superfamily